MSLRPFPFAFAFPAFAFFAFVLLLASSTAAIAQTEDSPPDPTGPRPSPLPKSPVLPTYAEVLDPIPSAERLADWHERFSSEPHVAGSDGDRRLIEKMAGYLESMELEVETHRFVTYLAEPVSARVEIVAEPEGFSGDPVFGGKSGSLPLALPIREPAVEGDPYLGHPDLDFGWNAYSGSGDVTAEVVYANYGTWEDFHRLRRLGVDVRGKIVIARYGGNFRGFKAKFAEEAGAAGLLLFTDPADSGYVRGAVYPEGGWAGPGYIQRGSLLTLPYSGDPLTPFEEATADAERLDPDYVALPLIPVQPVGWGAAYEILRRMDGEVVPTEWQGGLPLTYRLGGDELEVRLRVKQERELVETANVLGFLRGETYPDEWVVVGSHHDAWSFGAGDPNAGTILVFEAARAFADAAARGYRPERTLVFAHWGAEEFGIIGSTEWVEGRRDELLERAVAYVNLDGAAMGTRFSASASPSVKSLVADSARRVPQAYEEEQSVYEAWLGDRPFPPFGNLGGGSDHVGFYCHVGVPSMSLSTGGSPGVSYHSNYENLHWYRQVVGADYAGAVMLTRVVNRVLAGLADAPLLPLDPVAYGYDLRIHLKEVEDLARELGMEADVSALDQAAERYTRRAVEIHQLLLAAVRDGRLVDEGLARANRVLLQLERQWLHAPGLPERPWYRNLFAATDPRSGYGAWMLPALRWVVEQERPEPPPLPEPKPEEEEEEVATEDGEAGPPEEAEAPDEEAPEIAETEAEPTDAEVPDAEVPDAEPADAEPADAEEPAPVPVPELDLEQAVALYLEALGRLNGSLDQLQALLPGEILPDDPPPAESSPAESSPEKPSPAEGGPGEARATLE